MSQHLPCGPMIPHILTIPSESLQYMLIADISVYYIMCVEVIAVDCNHRGPTSHGKAGYPLLLWLGASQQPMHESYYYQLGLQR